MQSLAWLILCFLAAISASMPVRPDQAGLSRRSDDPSDAAGGKAPRLPGRPRGRPKPAVEKGYPKEFWKGRSIKGSPADPRYPFKDPLEEPPPFLWGRVELVNQCIDGMWRAWLLESRESPNDERVPIWALEGMDLLKAQEAVQKCAAKFRMKGENNARYLKQPPDKTIPRDPSPSPIELADLEGQSNLLKQARGSMKNGWGEMMRSVLEGPKSFMMRGQPVLGSKKPIHSRVFLPRPKGVPFWPR